MTPTCPHIRALLVLACALLACLAVPTVPLAAAASPTLEQGDHGRSVKRLQRLLHLPADGVFGPGTERAVKRFQRRHHLHADGVVGPGTWRMLRRAQARRAAGGSAGVTSRGASVRLLQQRLGIAADGIFGPGTLAAVKQFQAAHGLTADGVVGPATWAALGVRGSQPVLQRAGAGAHAGVPGAVWRAIRAANRIQSTPYIYGGGHASFEDDGYDCSGSVSYVLHGAGQLARPMNSSELMSYGAAGKGRYITIYANPGHTYMVIRGRRYDTSGQSRTGSRWQPDDRSSAGYTVRHPVGL